MIAGCYLQIMGLLDGLLTLASPKPHLPCHEVLRQICLDTIHVTHPVYTTSDDKVHPTPAPP